MKYKITVRTIEPNPADSTRYGNTREETIYEQVVEELDIIALVAVVNHVQGVKSETQR